MTWTDNLIPNAVLSMLFAGLGFLLLFIGWRVFDGFTPGHMRARIFEEDNRAAALFAGAFIIGFAVVAAAAIS